MNNAEKRAWYKSQLDYHTRRLLGTERGFVKCTPEQRDWHRTQADHYAKRLAEELKK